MRGCGIEWRGARRRKKKMAAGVIEFAVREPDGVASAVRKVTDSRPPTLHRHDANDGSGTLTLCDCYLRRVSIT